VWAVVNHEVSPFCLGSRQIADALIEVANGTAAPGCGRMAGDWEVSRLEVWAGVWPRGAGLLGAAWVAAFWVIRLSWELVTEGASVRGGGTADSWRPRAGRGGFRVADSESRIPSRHGAAGELLTPGQVSFGFPQASFWFSASSSRSAPRTSFSSRRDA